MQGAIVLASSKPWPGLAELSVDFAATTQLFVDRLAVALPQSTAIEGLQPVVEDSNVRDALFNFASAEKNSFEYYVFQQTDSYNGFVSFARLLRVSQMYCLRVLNRFVQILTSSYDVCSCVARLCIPPSALAASDHSLVLRFGQQSDQPHFELQALLLLRFRFHFKDRAN